MGYKAKKFMSLDLRQMETFEINVQGFKWIDLPNSKDQAFRISGVERNLGPVQALCPQAVAEAVEAGGEGVYRIRWGGVQKLKDGRQYNVFAVEQWEGKLPEWARGGETVETPDSDDIPF